MNPTLERVRQFVAEHNLVHHVEGDGEVLSLRMGLTHLTLTIFWQVEPDLGVLRLYARLPVNIPRARRAVVAEFLSRLTANLHLGYFGLDFNDGEPFFRMDADVNATDLRDEVLGRWLSLACTMVDGFFPALMSVAYANMKPQPALEQGEAAYEALLKEQMGKKQDNDKSGASGE